MTYHVPDHPNWQPGAEPGIDTAADSENVSPQLQALRANCDIKIVDFSDSEVKHITANNETLSAILAEPRSDELACRWISVNGLSWDVIKVLGNKYGLHRLAIEDLIMTRSRTKVDWYSDHAFIVLTLQKLVRLHQHDNKDGPCDCPVAEDVDFETGLDDKHKNSWWQPAKSRRDETLPTYERSTAPGKMAEYIKAHSNTSQDSPVQPIRTLHRYESGQNPEHTAFMEKHSVLASEDLVVSVEQVSIFLMADNTVISIFEHSAPDVESPILERLETDETMLRRGCDASLLMQAIVDAIVDLALPVKDAYNKARKELQVDVLTNPSIRTSRSLHIFGEEIDMLQNLFKPIVHLVNALRDHNAEPINMGIVPPYMASQQDLDQQQQMPGFGRIKSDFGRRKPMKRTPTASTVIITPLAHTYLGDVLDHCITTIQSLEQMDASVNNLSTLIFNTVGARTNNFMMILAVVTVFFSPLTFVSGYFGMNFSNGNGLDHPFAFFWVVAIPVLVVFILIVIVTMMWDSFMSFLAKRGVRASRRRRAQRRYH